VNELLVKKTGKKQTQQILGEGCDGAPGGQVLPIEMIDAADLCVRGDQFFRKLGNGRFHAGSIPQRQVESKPVPPASLTARVSVSSWLVLRTGCAQRRRKQRKGETKMTCF
jgi:hypothetical protein